MTEITREQVKHIPNPTGKGGFQERPQDRHSGSWKKIETFRFWYDTFKEMTVTELKNWQKNNPEDTRKVVADLAFNAVVKAKNDLKYQIEVTDRTEGKSLQKLEHSGGLELQISKLENLIDDLLTEDTENTEIN